VWPGFIFCKTAVTLDIVNYGKVDKTTLSYTKSDDSGFPDGGSEGSGMHIGGEILILNALTRCRWLQVLRAESVRVGP